ncbi:hypothetical protein TTHERM_000460501 (macronuclear) [Tetrahymena thermophila SB210]|uniref:Uncharacterized protein n=1 Tax=Tetrahymena thermophila (strain SB210) TaxID=312017 RepID=W7X2Y9_TETTS|nr:hypothetical protein TTHERM_000460501 [Tetrahymena thermophila SB210]EWS73690.1 hypothetical protein TTHERM_000460501 [Tetrahymena thermophila SB210]|eukprot:XP_012653728.1 hypothetical protein TTHERM_000460501 [Tetrahymena thermophila SB210]
MIELLSFYIFFQFIIFLENLEISFIQIRLQLLFKINQQISFFYQQSKFLFTYNFILKINKIFSKQNFQSFFFKKYLIDQCCLVSQDFYFVLSLFKLDLHFKEFNYGFVEVSFSGKQP